MADNWVIQMEGWLLKRGAGYNKDEKGKKVSFFMPKRRGTLIRKGTAEKKRYFYLLTQSPDAGNPPKAELRYFTSQRAHNAAAKGSVVFNSSIKVQLQGHSTVCLITEGRTYYLRPDKSAGDPSSAQSRTTAGKWIHAFDFAVNGLKAWELAGTHEVSEALHPVTRMSTKLSLEEIERNQKRVAEFLQRKTKSLTESPATPTDGAANSERHSVVQENRAKLQGSAEKFEMLWDQFGLHGYNAVVAHFGPVQIDLKRMEDHLKVRCQLLEAELSLFEKQNYRSQDVAANEQTTTANLLIALHKSFDRRAEHASGHLKRMEEEVLQPISQMIVKIDSELDSIVSFHDSTTKNIERLYKGVSDLSENIQALQVAYKNSVPSATKEKVRNPFMGRSKAPSVSTEDPAAIIAELNSTKELLSDCKTALQTEEVKHASRMKMALRSLHALEVERLNKQTQVIQRLVELERDIFNIAERYFDTSGEFMQALCRVDPASDVQDTSERLKRDLRDF